MNNKSNWQVDLAQTLKSTVSSVDDFVDQRWRALKSRMGLDGRARIQPYIGMANDEHLSLSGRVLSNPIPTPPSETDSWWDNLLATYERWESDEVPGIDVELSVNGKQFTTTTDKEGYFHFEIGLENPLSKAAWHQVSLRITGDSPQNADLGSVTASIRTLTDDAAFGIISDMDDTVIHTGITGLLTAARLTFLNNARTRTPLKGVGELYRAFANGPTETNQQNPIFYVSSSPWNMFDLLVEFLALNDIPKGPLQLRDLGFDKDKFLKDGHGHKLKKAEHIIKSFPNLPFVLIGDSGQQDAELYASAVKNNPGRIAAVFIRDVDPGEQSDRDTSVDNHLEEIKNAGVRVRRAETSLEMAHDAIDLGLLSKSQLPEIERAFAAEANAGTSSSKST